MWPRTILASFVMVIGAGAAMGGTPPRVTAPETAIANQQQALAARLRQDWLAAGKPLPAAGTALAITAGRVLTPSLNVASGAASPKVGFQFTTGSAGLYSVTITFVSQTSGQVLELSYYSFSSAGPAPTGGTLVLQQPVSNSFIPSYGSVPTSLGNYAAPGTWTMTQIFIDDAAGNYVYYQQAQIAQIFSSSSFNVINPVTPDTTRPVVIAGAVLTPIVSLGAAKPAFGVTLKVSDNLSGVNNTTVLVAAPGETGGYGSFNVTPSPVRRGALATYTSIDANSPLGTWTITGYEVCDVAGNCLTDSSAADVQALFGTTTFTVTN